MNKNKLKITLLSVALLALFITSNVALASEVTGILRNSEVVVVVPPTASPAGGTYTSVQEVTLSARGSSSIRYSFDGTTSPACSPSDQSLTYQTPIPITVTRTIKAVSCYSNNTISSAVVSFAYIINIPAPVVPTGGSGGGGGGGGGGYSAPLVNPSDINKDGKVDKYDFSIMMANWGKTGDNSADLNNDKKVDKYDFALLMAKWTKQ